MWDKFSSWLPILSISLTAFLLVSSELIPIGILNQISTDLDIHPSHIGLMISIPGLVAAVSAIIFPFMFKNVNRQFIFISLTIIMIVSNLIVYFSQHYVLILFGRMIIGIAIGGFATISITSCRLYVPDTKKIAMAISIVMAGMTLATVLGLPFGIWMSQMVGWRQIFLIIALISFILLLLQLKLLPKRYSTEAISFKNIPVLILNSQTRFHVGLALLIFLAHFICYSYISILLEQFFNLDNHSIAILLCMFGAFSVVGNLITARVKEQGINFYLLFSFSLFCLSLGLILSKSLALLYLACSLWGLAFGIFSSCINIFITFKTPQHIENGMPLLISFIQLTITLGSAIGGMLLQQLGIHFVITSSLILFLVCLSMFFAFGLKNQLFKIESRNK